MNEKKLMEFFSEERAQKRRDHAMAQPVENRERVRAFFEKDPPSQQICGYLNRVEFDVCPHGRNPCFLRCGVRGVSKQSEAAAKNARPWPRTFTWVPIPPNERIGWLMP